MAETKFTFISLENLQQYDSLLKPYIDDKVSEGVKTSFKTVAIDGNTLKFYNVDAPVGSTAPVYTIELPETDISGLVAKIKNAVAGDVVIANADGTIADGGVKLADLAKSEDVTAAIGTAKDTLAKDIKTNTDAIAKLNGTEDTEGSVAKAVKDAKDALQSQITENKTTISNVDGKVGSLDDLTTTEKATVVGALNEVKAAVDSAKENDAVTIDTSVTTTGMAKSYTIKQGKTTVGTIDIPKDMVVKSGTVEKDPAGQTAGTYLVLTLANAAEDKIYINVGTLVDIYKAKAEASQIQVAIDASTREISATIVAGSVTATELAANAVVTAKIADGNVTKVKLSKEVQATLDKADTALQESDVATLRTDVAAVKASIAEGGATDKAIKAAKDAADTAQAGVDGLTTRVEALESVKYVSATEDEIKGLFGNA